MLIPHVRTDTARAPWAPFESQVYSLAVADASLYQQALLVARALADELRLAPSAERLVALWPQGTEMAAAAASGRGLAAAGLPLGAIAAAGFALRASEIRMLVQGRARRERIEAAKQAGAAWVTLDEFGAIDAGMLDPYRCVEMHLASGWAVVCRAGLGTAQGAAAFAVSIARLDPLTGDVLDIAPDMEHSAECSTPQALASWRHEARLRVEALPAASVR